MGKGIEYGNPKKVIKPKMFSIFSGWMCFVFATVSVCDIISLYIQSLNQERLEVKVIISILVIRLVYILAFLEVGIISLKMAKNIYFYDDGFVHGKNGEKTFYKNLHYFFISGLKPNKFQSIFYQAADGEYRNIFRHFFPIEVFNQLQEDVVKVTYSDAMENINNGGTEEFPFLAPKKFLFALSRKKIPEIIKKSMNEADKIKITREYMSIADKIYRWDQYRISGKFGNIVVEELNRRIVTKLTKLRVDRPNLLEALIETFNRS